MLTLGSKIELSVDEINVRPEKTVKISCKCEW